MEYILVDRQYSHFQNFASSVLSYSLSIGPHFSFSINIPSTGASSSMNGTYTAKPITPAEIIIGKFLPGSGVNEGEKWEHGAANRRWSHWAELGPLSRRWNNSEEGVIFLTKYVMFDYSKKNDAFDKAMKGHSNRAISRTTSPLRGKVMALYHFFDASKHCSYQTVVGYLYVPAQQSVEMVDGVLDVCVHVAPWNCP